MPVLVESLVALTGRELQVLELASVGATVKSTATTLVISPETVKSHRKMINRKLGTGSMAHAVGEAFRDGLLV